MTGKKEKALELLVLGQFKTYDDVAQELKISVKTLYNWRKEEEFSKELNRRINIKIGGIAPKALKKMEKLIDSDDPHVALLASKDVLDRAGYKATDKVDVNADTRMSGAVNVCFEGELDEWSE